MLPFGPLLGVAALLLLGGPPTQAAQGSSSHSLRHFCTSVSEPGQGLPQFISVGYVDDQVICQYDSNSRRVRRRVAWMEKADAQYWDAQTQIMRGKEAEFRGDMVTLKKRYNQSEGFHTWQEMSSCELRKDGSKGGHLQYAYDGRDFISLDLETLTWTAADVPAQTTKKEWEAEPAIAESSKVYLEEDCIEWLQKFLDYGKEMLLRIQPPVGKVTCQAVGDGQEVFICQAHGFYPKEIEATWRKGEEILEHETFRRNIAPNSDGTYHIWLSIEIDPKERNLYRCHVDHASLPEPLVLALEEPGGERLEWEKE
ncbi:H-2 class I histocompatibility antigen, Q9 alpha chain-like isoform X1 [Sceloporus undulatus]|uniref:H-2 class I histocompatibility antigen, Q9 alpha chain-like isoform X1 n=1 Tax=Sceloporus undulatus TaxID=8520 RepID=UPI001C4CB88C|nr:H-2 class I histocompatibility antigen, Q9 alpha chain-like isoform X1 [Sceloporus undulatus]